MVNEILNTKISFFENVWSGNPKEVILGEVIRSIKDETYRGITSTLRKHLENDEHESYAFLKKKLNAVTFCGVFEDSRTKTSLVKYNHLLVIDVDKLTQHQMRDTQKKLLDDQYVFTYWISPSNQGIKGLIKLNYNFDINITGIDQSHKMGFNQIAEYFEKAYQITLDKSGSDVTRLCFLSWDSNLILKENVVPFVINEASTKSSTERHIKKIGKRDVTNNIRDVLDNPAGKNLRKNRKIIKKIINYLNKKSLSITYDYYDWLRVAFAIADSFTYEVGIKYFLALSRMDLTKFNENENERLLRNCYIENRGYTKFSTIIYLAKEKGFQVKN